MGRDDEGCLEKIRGWNGLAEHVRSEVNRLVDGIPRCNNDGTLTRMTGEHLASLCLPQ